MRTILELTFKGSDNIKLDIFADKIVGIAEASMGSTIYIDGGLEFRVEENRDQVREMLGTK